MLLTPRRHRIKIGNCSADEAAEVSSLLSMLLLRAEIDGIFVRNVTAMDVATHRALRSGIHFDT